MTKMRIISIVILIIGSVTLAVGVVFLVLYLTRVPKIADGEYIVAKQNWTLVQDDCPSGGELVECDGSSVIWQFAEIGKGSLTTNNHLNDYTFQWALKDGHLIIRTDWLYELDNDYEYELDQDKGILILAEGDTKYRFMAQAE